MIRTALFFVVFTAACASKQPVDQPAPVPQIIEEPAVMQEQVPAMSGVDQLTIKLNSGFATGVDLTCAGSSLGRKNFSDGAVVFTGVPSANCKASFKGGDSGSVNISVGVSSVICDFDGIWVCNYDE